MRYKVHLNQEGQFGTEHIAIGINDWCEIENLLSALEADKTISVNVEIVRDTDA